VLLPTVFFGLLWLSELHRRLLPFVTVLVFVALFLFVPDIVARVFVKAPKHIRRASDSTPFAIWPTASSTAGPASKTRGISEPSACLP
jgi:hypothetical protein